ncbi:acyl-CoA dehydrogenase family protein [Zhongshania aquimaris]|nr:acyl-CoA dehydrogenase family protein [Zhongshania aquimaris]
MNNSLTMPIERTIFCDEQKIFRQSVRRFMEDEIVPNMEDWMAQGYVSREVWRKAGELGMLCTTIPENYGGSGVCRKYSAIIIEEQQYANSVGPGFAMHSEIVACYINRLGTEEQKSKWLPKMARGEVIGSLGMTEPGAGSDLKQIKTKAIRDGDELVINGSKTFITNGYLTDLIILAVKTDSDSGAKGISLVLVEANREGFTKGSTLNKIGQKAQDTAELFFNNVRVPASNILGEPGLGFQYMMEELAWERLIIAIRAIAGAEAALSHTIDYVKNRQVFNKPLSDFQNTKFKLAECKSETQIGRVYIDNCLELLVANKLDAEASAMAKWWCTELQNRVIDTCLQLHGGYGYILEYPIARAWIDARPQMIYGGTNEIMKEIIGRKL